MASARSSRFRLFLIRWLPDLFRICPAGNYHWRWERFCWCRYGEHSGSGENEWHGGVLCFRTGEELFLDWWSRVAGLNPESKKGAMR
jgi:hypothetical protein